MLGRDEFAEAARNTDAVAEGIGIVAWAEREDIELSGMVYVAEQRALRLCMILDGQNPNVAHARVVLLPDALQKLMPHFTSAIIDGIAIGRAAREADDAS